MREEAIEYMHLDTCRFMTDAQRLYRSREFIEREPWLKQSGAT